MAASPLTSALTGASFRRAQLPYQGFSVPGMPAAFGAAPQQAAAGFQGDSGLHLSQALMQAQQAGDPGAAMGGHAGPPSPNPVPDAGGGGGNGGASGGGGGTNWAALGLSGPPPGVTAMDPWVTQIAPHGKGGGLHWWLMNANVTDPLALRNYLRGQSGEGSWTPGGGMSIDQWLAFLKTKGWNGGNGVPGPQPVYDSGSYLPKPALG